MLTFNSEGHVYFWDGKEVPGVSQILKGIGITRDFDRVDPFYRDRGIFVHKAVQFHIKKTLDEASVDPDNVLPYLKAFQSYESAGKYVPHGTEIPLYSQKYGFAGMIDQTGHLPEFREEGITDLKATEKSDKAADIQLCLYAVLYHENYGNWPAFRMVLELHGDQTATPIFYDSDPEEICGAVMTLWKWKSTKHKRTAKDAPKRSSGG